MALAGTLRASAHRQPENAEGGPRDCGCRGAEIRPVLVVWRPVESCLQLRVPSGADSRDAGLVRSQSDAAPQESRQALGLGPRLIGVRSHLEVSASPREPLALEPRRCRKFAIRRAFLSQIRPPHSRSSRKAKKIGVPDARTRGTLIAKSSLTIPHGSSTRKDHQIDADSIRLIADG